MNRIDTLVRKHTGWTSLLSLATECDPRYRPSIDVSDRELLAIADAYDALQAGRGDARRAWRYGTQWQPSMASLKADISEMTQEMLKDARAEYQVARSREALVLAVAGEDERVFDEPMYISASRITLKALRGLYRRAQQELRAAGRTDTVRISIHLSVDGSDNFSDLLEGVYDPVVGARDIDVPASLLA